MNKLLVSILTNWHVYQYYILDYINDFTAEPTNVNLNQTYVISTQDESTDTKDDEDAAPNTSVFAQDLGSFTQPENQEESNLELPDITPHHITDEAEITYEMVEAATSRGKVYNMIYTLYIYKTCYRQANKHCHYVL